jgi:hypothetical protein
MMYSRNCERRTRRGKSQLGRIYHGSRVRGGHDDCSLILLIDVTFASEMLDVAPDLLKTAARHGLIPHYRFEDHIRFDPIEVDRWARKHRITEFTPTTKEVE